MADPTLDLYDSTGALVATNDNWRDTQEANFIEGGPYAMLRPANEFEAALAAKLRPGAYSAVVRGKNGTTGTALAEVYDYSGGANSKFASISARGFVQTGNDVLVSGLGVQGEGIATLILRALGPSLASSGIANVLSDPTLELRDNDGTLMAFDDNWRDSADQASQIEATGLAPASFLEPAIAVVLAPGNYTVIVRGKNDATGIVAFEIYDLGAERR